MCLLPRATQTVIYLKQKEIAHCIGCDTGTIPTLFLQLNKSYDTEKKSVSEREIMLTYCLSAMSYFDSKWTFILTLVE